MKFFVAFETPFAFLCNKTDLNGSGATRNGSSNLMHRKLPALWCILLLGLVNCEYEKCEAHVLQ